MTDLLAKDGTADNQRQGRLGKILHDFSKWAIRKAIARERKRLDPVLKYKKEKGGWINPDIAELEKAFEWVISLDDLPYQFGGFREGSDPNRAMLQDLKDITCCHLDEDTHWHLRFMVLLYYIHNHWEDYDVAATRAYHFLSVSAKTLGLTMNDMYEDLEKFRAQKLIEYKGEVNNVRE